MENKPEKNVAPEPYLSEPTAAVKDSYLEAVGEFEAAQEWSAEEAKNVRDDFDGWVERLKNRALGKDLPEGYVPESIFWLIEGDKYIGRIGVRHVLTEKLKKFGGTIGYDVRPSERRKGYGTKMLALGLQKAAELGLNEVILTCDVNNVASQKVIEANGGELLERGVVVEEQPDATRQRYKIALGSTSPQTSIKNQGKK
jgi:predicted acetyltransferase